MDADDAWPSEVTPLRTKPDQDPLALDEDTAERLLAGDLPPAQAPPGYGEVAALLAAAVAAPSPAELAGQEAAVAELQAVIRTRQAPGGPASRVGVGSGWWSRLPSERCRPVASRQRPPGTFQIPSAKLPGAS